MKNENEIGRNKHGNTSVKHKIKSVDRLLSNGKRLSENFRIQTAAAQLIIGKRNKLRILVDWSVTTRNWSASRWRINMLMSDYIRYCLLRT